MAENFQIATKKINDQAFIIISGDFDGSSAFELINFINSSCPECNQIVVNTSKLNKIHPFGRKIFKSKEYLFKNSSKQVVFTGGHAKELTN